MKKNLMPLVGVAFVAALIATGFFYGLLIPRLRGGGETVDSRQVVVAKSALPRGATLRAEDVDRVAMDPGHLPKGSFLRTGDAVGLVLLEPVSEGQVLQRSMFAERGAKGGASLAIPEGMRAVTIHPQESGGVVALLRSGSKVDVQVIERGNAGLTVRRMLENVEVLSTGSPNGMARPDVTVLATPDDADRLSLADASMSLRVVLRNPSDKSVAGPVAMRAQPK